MISDYAHIVDRSIFIDQYLYIISHRYCHKLYKYETYIEDMYPSAVKMTFGGRGRFSVFSNHATKSVLLQLIMTTVLQYEYSSMA